MKMDHPYHSYPMKKPSAFHEGTETISERREMAEYKREMHAEMHEPMDDHPAPKAKAHPFYSAK